MNNSFAQIDSKRTATYKQFEFAVYKLAEGLAKKKRIPQKISGKSNPAFKILKARVSAATAKYYGDKNSKITHGDAQKFISSGVIPNDILALVKDTKDLKKKS